MCESGPRLELAPTGIDRWAAHDCRQETEGATGYCGDREYQQNGVGCVLGDEVGSL